MRDILVLFDGLRARGFAFVAGRDMRDALGAAGLDDWGTFATSWDDLHLDRHMADGGRYRRRRHGLFAATADRVWRRPHGPHFQSVDYNPLNGGIERWFEPITEEVGASTSLSTILAWARDLFGQLAAAGELPTTPTPDHPTAPMATEPSMMALARTVGREPPGPDRPPDDDPPWRAHPTVARWDIEVHQFRIEARGADAGNPTPEGIHRDGVDYVLVLLVQRTNIESGTTTIHEPDGTLLGSFTLTEPFDSALVVDERVFHGVTPVQAIDPTRPAYRDVLVVTFRAA